MGGRRAAGAAGAAAGGRTFAIGALIGVVFVACEPLGGNPAPPVHAQPYTPAVVGAVASVSYPVLTFTDGRTAALGPDAWIVADAGISVGDLVFLPTATRARWYAAFRADPLGGSPYALRAALGDADYLWSTEALAIDDGDFVWFDSGLRLPKAGTFRSYGSGGRYGGRLGGCTMNRSGEVVACS